VWWGVELHVHLLPFLGGVLSLAVVIALPLFVAFIYIKFVLKKRISPRMIVIGLAIYLVALLCVFLLLLAGVDRFQGVLCEEGCNAKPYETVLGKLNYGTKRFGEQFTCEKTGTEMSCFVGAVNKMIKDFNPNLSEEKKEIYIIF
jgi:hypothetical protein